MRLRLAASLRVARLAATVGLLVVVPALLPSAATADVIITTYPAHWGGTGGDYMVQTFTSPNDDTYFNSLMVNVRATGPSVTLSIFDWTGQNVSQDSYADIVGTPLFSTLIQTPEAAFFDVTVFPRITLNPSTVYGIVLTALCPSGGTCADNQAGWTYGLGQVGPNGDAYSGGEYFTRISDANHWSGHGGADLAFRAEFTPQPVPELGSTVTYLASGLIVIAGAVRLRKRQG